MSSYVFNDQAYLIWKKIYEKLSMSTDTGGSKSKFLSIDNEGGKIPLNIIKGRYSPKTFISKVLKDKKLNIYRDFIDLETHKLSALVPQIKLYKVEKNKYIPFYFPVNTEATTITDVLHAHGGAHGVGIKSVNVEFAGTDMFMRDKNIACSLTIYVQNLASVFKAPPAGFAKIADLFTISTKKYTPLKQDAHKEISVDQITNPTNFEIVLNLGYSIPDGEMFKSAEIAAIKGSVLSIRMTMHNHTISVEQDGSANINIEYTGRLDNHLNDSFYNLLTTPINLLELAGTKAGSGKMKLASLPGSAKTGKTKKLENKIHQVQGLFFMRQYLEYLDYATEEDSRIYNLEVDDESDFRSFLEGLEEAEKSSSVLPPAPPGKVKTKTAVKNSPKDLKRRNINYIYFGSLLEAVLSSMRSNLNDAITLAKAKLKKEKDDAEKESLRRKSKLLNEKLEFFKTFRIFLTDIDIAIDKRGNTINIANIPISLSTYCDFMFKRITQKNMRSFTLQQFLDEVTGYVLGKAFQSSSDAKALDSGIVFKTMTVSGDKLDSKSLKKTILDIKRLPSFLKRTPSKTSKEDMDYRIIYGEIEKHAASGRGGEVQKDTNEGIYHFHLGKDRGILKTIDFQRDDAPYRKEMLMTNAVSLYDELKMPYSATITMFGNNLFLPGSMIFINPASLGFGDPRNKKSAASRIGLGGYYQVLNVTTTLDSNNSLVTVLKAAFNNWADEALSLFGEQPETAKINYSPEASKSKDAHAIPPLKIGESKQIKDGEFYKNNPVLTPGQENVVQDYFKDHVSWKKRPLPAIRGTREINHYATEEELVISFKNDNGSTVIVKKNVDNSGGSVEFTPAD